MAAAAMATVCAMRTGKLPDMPFAAVAISTATPRQTTTEARIRRPAGQCASIEVRVPRSAGSTETGARRGSAERACDHQALDLVRALVDLRDLGVAQVALDGILGHIAVAAEDLDRVDGHRHGGVRGEELRHGRVLPEVGLAAVDLRAGLVEQLARRRRARLHVRELELDALELGDRPAELAPFARVRGGVIRGALRDAHGLGGDAEARAVERGERDVHALVDLADQVLGGDADVVED